MDDKKRLRCNVKKSQMFINVPFKKFIKLSIAPKSIKRESEKKVVSFLQKISFLSAVCTVDFNRFSKSGSLDTTDKRSYVIAEHKEIGVTWKQRARCSFSGSTAIPKIDEGSSSSNVTRPYRQISAQRRDPTLSVIGDR